MLYRLAVDVSVNDTDMRSCTDDVGGGDGCGEGANVGVLSTAPMLSTVTA